MTPTATVAKTETFGGLEAKTAAADTLDLIAGSLEMDWAPGGAVVSEPRVRSLAQVMGFALLLSACLWGAIFGLIQLI